MKFLLGLVLGALTGFAFFFILSITLQAILR